MRTHLLPVLAGLLLATGACKDKQPSGEPSSSKTAEPAAPAPTTWKQLGGLGLEAEVPEDATIDDNTQGAGFPSATLWTSPTMFVSGVGDMSDLKSTIEATKAELAKDPNKLKAFTREDKTDDGWILELTREAMIEPGKELLGISVRRTIDGKPWDCGSNVDSRDELEKVKKICQSLRAAR